MQTPAQDLEIKLKDLRRIKFVATAAVVLCFLVFLLARWLDDVSPIFGFVAAFAEAATIGGLADWYAVVALFRHPMGLPIPHTAIIPSNQERIADNLGRFIEENFLGAETVESKLGEVDFAELIADWLSDPSRAERLSAFVARMAPQALTAIDESGLRAFVGQRLSDQVERVPVAPIAANLLSAFTDEGRHQKLLDDLISILNRFLNDEVTLEAMREKVRMELPTLFNLFRADAYLLSRIVASASSLLEDVRADPEHPLRGEFERFLKNFIRRMKRSKQFQARAEEMKRELLRRPELANLVEQLWQSFSEFLLKDAADPNSMLVKHMTGLFVDIGKQLAREPKIRADMNAGFVVALSSFVEAQKTNVSEFIAVQVRGWDLAQLVRLVEANIGRDLQFIRFNGMLVGGIAGTLLYILEKALF